ncbi:hypothetical protein LCGC14_0581630 [marine sediment metagenome]|uniref:DNA methylase N-4/N-6 domain-containing protein n=1 Tax=marine sediment metagenome TaxID=412755 RepID=A0A0F9UPF5_9ZZZZ
MPYLGLETIRRGTSGACIEDCFRIIYPNAKTVADLTYGKGRFWKWPSDDMVLPDVVKLDLEPIGGAEVQASYCYVPLKDQSVEVAIFDPPFIFSPGLRGIIGAKRFFLGVTTGNDPRINAPRNSKQLYQQTVVAMQEMRRIARHGMILKGQDLITSQHPNWWTYQVMNIGDRLLGLWPEDVLLQVSPAARMRDPRWKNQYHFRRAHAYYICYRWGD